MNLSSYIHGGKKFLLIFAGSIKHTQKKKKKKERKTERKKERKKKKKINEGEKNKKREFII